MTIYDGSDVVKANQTHAVFKAYVAGVDESTPRTFFIQTGAELTFSGELRVGVGYEAKLIQGLTVNDSAKVDAGAVSLGFESGSHGTFLLQAGTLQTHQIFVGNPLGGKVDSYKRGAL